MPGGVLQPKIVDLLAGDVDGNNTILGGIGQVDQAQDGKRRAGCRDREQADGDDDFDEGEAIILATGSAETAVP